MEKMTDEITTKQTELCKLETSIKKLFEVTKELDLEMYLLDSSLKRHKRELSVTEEKKVTQLNRLTAADEDINENINKIATTIESLKKFRIENI